MLNPMCQYRMCLLLKNVLNAVHIFAFYTFTSFVLFNVNLYFVHTGFIQIFIFTFYRTNEHLLHFCILSYHWSKGKYLAH